LSTSFAKQSGELADKLVKTHGTKTIPTKKQSIVKTQTPLH